MFFRLGSSSVLRDATVSRVLRCLTVLLAASTLVGSLTAQTAQAAPTLTETQLRARQQYDNQYLWIAGAIDFASVGALPYANPMGAGGVVAPIVMLMQGKMSRRVSYREFLDIIERPDLKEEMVRRSQQLQGDDQWAGTAFLVGGGLGVGASIGLFALANDLSTEASTLTGITAGLVGAVGITSAIFGATTLAVAADETDYDRLPVSVYDIPNLVDDYNIKLAKQLRLPLEIVAMSTQNNVDVDNSADNSADTNTDTNTDTNGGPNHQNDGVLGALVGEYVDDTALPPPKPISTVPPKIERNTNAVAYKLVVLPWEMNSKADQSLKTVAAVVEQSVTVAFDDANITHGIAFDVLSSQDVKAMASLEAEKQVLGCASDSSCLTEIASAMGAQFVVYGNVSKLGDQHIILCNLFDSKNSKSLGRKQVKVKHVEDIPEAMQETVRQILRNVVG